MQRKSARLCFDALDNKATVLFDAVVSMGNLQIPSGETIYSLRPYHPADAAQVVGMVNAEGQQVLGLRRAALDAYGQVRLMRYVPPANTKVVAVTAQGQIAGFAYVANREQGIIYELGGAVQPAHWGQGIGAQLLAWGEQRVRSLIQAAPAGVNIVLQANLFEDEQRARRLYGRAGFAQVREWTHFAIDMQAPPVPVIPAGITLQAIDLDDDWDRLGPAMDEAFADHWGAIAASLPTPPDFVPAEEMPEDESYSNAPGFCFMALDDDEVAGGILCNAKLVERTDTGRVGSVFVRPQYRRRGIGQALMLTAFAAFWRAGLRRIILDTDAESFTQSPRFYAHLGMQAYRREFLYEKVIRSGREVRRLA